MDDSPYPPWTPAPDETRVSGSYGFTQCDQVLEALASRGNGSVVERQYSTSKEWGKIVRAKIRLPQGPATHLVNCWQDAEANVAIATMVDET